MTCRLCFDKSTVEVLDIFDAEGIQLQIADIISKHFWFSPSKDDPISDKICCSCWSKLNNFHEFYCFVENAEKNFKNSTKSTIIKNSDSLTILPLELPLSTDDLKKEQILPLSTDDLKKEQIWVEELNVTNDDSIVQQNEKFLNEDLCKISNEKYKVASRKSARLKKYNQLITKDCEDKVKTEESNSDSNDQNYELEMMEESSQNTLLKKSNRRKQYKKSLKQKEKEARKQRPDSKLNELEKLAQQKKIEEENELIAKYVRMDCDTCYENFITFSQLKNHIKKVHHKRSGYVKCCNKKIFKRGSLLDHVNFHINPNIFSCLMCDKKFKNNDNLKYHVASQHDVDKSDLLSCDQCQKQFIKKSILDRHKLMHAPLEERHFKCEVCQKKYPTSTHLKVHIRTVHEKAYDLVCDICAKKLPCKKQLDKHKLEHEGITEPKVQCQKCGSWLKNAIGLRKHMQLHKEALLGLRCEICGKEAVSKGSLRDHMRNMHSKQRIFKCTFCEKAFKEKKILKEHIATHTGGALYTCLFCPKTFNSNANMYTHRKKVHPKEWEEARQQKIASSVPSLLKLCS